MDSTVDPLAPENRLIFADVPRSGACPPLDARYALVSKGELNVTLKRDTTSNVVTR